MTDTNISSLLLIKLKYVAKPALILVLLIGAALDDKPVYAETVYLTTGESIEGEIISMDPNSITIESEKGYGTLNINREEVTFVDFNFDKRNLVNEIGIGYNQKIVITTQGNEAIYYGEGGVAVKYWVNDHWPVEVVLSAIKSDANGVELFGMVSTDVRSGYVLYRDTNYDIYVGGSLGFVWVNDITGKQTADGFGFSYGAFGGIEAFLPSFPTVSISAEIGINGQMVSQKTGGFATSILVIAPTISIKKYF